MKMKQLALFKMSSAKSFGGNLGQGKRKTARPLDRGKPLHLVMRSSKAKGALSLKTKEIEIESLLRKAARHSGVRIENFANVGNHLHILLRFQNRGLFQKWLKNIAGKIARLITGARKGRPFGKFWDALAFTRIVSWGKDLIHVRDYVDANGFEGVHNKWVREIFLWQQQHWRQLQRERALR